MRDAVHTGSITLYCTVVWISWEKIPLASYEPHQCDVPEGEAGGHALEHHHHVSPVRVILLGRDEISETILPQSNVRACVRESKGYSSQCMAMANNGDVITHIHNENERAQPQGALIPPAEMHRRQFLMFWPNRCDLSFTHRRVHAATKVGWAGASNTTAVPCSLGHTRRVYKALPAHMLCVWENRNTTLRCDVLYCRQSVNVFTKITVEL